MPQKENIFTHKSIKYLYLPETSSTMDYCKNLVKAGTVNWSKYKIISVEAGFQSQGRGQYGKSWSSPPGKGVYLSLLFKAPKTLSQDFTIEFTSFLIETLKSYPFLDQLSLKPINDVYYKSCKLAGVLIESFSDTEKSKFLSIGVGINTMVSTHQIKEAFASKAKAEPISIEEITGSRVIAQKFLSEFPRLLAKKFLMKYLMQGTK